MPDASDRARRIILAHGGTIRTREALAAGIHPRTLYRMRDTGAIERLSRGLYRLSDLPPVGDPDLALVAGRVPHGVICLISALSIHELSTQIPHAVHLAIPRTARPPRLDHPPLEVYRFSKQSYEAGIEAHDVGGAMIRVYNAEKTIADVFKYRNKLGVDLAVEALRTYLRMRGSRVQRVLEYARVNRVARVMTPYLEASL